MELIIPETKSSRSLRCLECGRPLHWFGNDAGSYCRACEIRRKKGREVLTEYKPIKCMCGLDAIVDYPMILHNASGSPIIYLEPLCFPCFMLEISDGPI